MKTLCVYCGSRPGTDPAYLAAGTALGELLVRRNIGLVYGGASVGVMGAVADAVLARGGRVIGIIPKALAVKEVAHDRLTEQHVVGSMHERKALMAERSDGFVALPGGWGTFEEIFEVLTWGQLGFHEKPCGLLNVNGYYDHLHAFLEHAVESGFVPKACREMLLVEEAPDRLLDRYATYEAPKVRKWITREDET